MHQLILSKAWPARIIRIAVLVGIGWWFAKDLVYAQLPVSLEWPNTDFDNTLVDLDDAGVFVLHAGPDSPRRWLLLALS